MHVALLLALLVPMQENRKSIGNATSLVTTDWSDSSRILALRQGEAWDGGTAWFFKLDGQLAAWKGEYKFYAPAKPTDDMLLLKIGFTRRYVAVGDNGSRKWQLDRKYEPKGMMLEIPLEDGAVPKGKVEFSVVRGFFVDESGKETVKRYAPDGFLQKLSGEGSVKTLRELDYVTIGETLEFANDRNPFEYNELDEFLPPGFKARKSPTP